MAGLVDNIFGITERQYEQERQQGLRDLADRLSSSGNISADRAMLGATIGDYLGTKLGVAMGGTDPRQEVRDNKAKMEALNTEVSSLSNKDPNRFYLQSDAAREAGNFKLAIKLGNQGRLLERQNASDRQTMLNMEQRRGDKEATEQDNVDIREAAAKYQNNPTEANKEAAILVGVSTSDLASIARNRGGEPTPAQKKRIMGDWLHSAILKSPHTPIKVLKANNDQIWDSIYGAEGVGESDFMSAEAETQATGMFMLKNPGSQ